MNVAYVKRNLELINRKASFLDKMGVKDARNWGKVKLSKDAINELDYMTGRMLQEIKRIIKRVKEAKKTGEFDQSTLNIVHFVKDKAEEIFYEVDNGMVASTDSKGRRKFKDSLEDKMYKASDKVGSLMSDLYDAGGDLSRQSKKLSKTLTNKSSTLTSQGPDLREIYNGWFADEIDQAITDIEDDLKSFKKGEDGLNWDQSDQKDLEKDLKVLKSMLKTAKKYANYEDKLTPLMDILLEADDEGLIQYGDMEYQYLSDWANKFGNY